MARIAISYRREDTGWITGRIFDRLKNHYEDATNTASKEKSIVFLDYDLICAVTHRSLRGGITPGWA